MKNIFKLFRQYKIGQKSVTLVILGLAVYLILPQIAVLEKSWYVLTSMALWAVGAAFIARAISSLGSGFLLQNLLAIVNPKVSLWINTLVCLGSTSIGLVSGGMVGGSAAIFRWTSGSKGSTGGAILASIFWPLFDTLMLVIFSIFGLVHLILVHRLTPALTIGFVFTLVILGLVLGCAGFAVRYRDQATKAILWTLSHVARLRRQPFDPDPILREASDLFGAWDSLWQVGGWLRPVLGAFLNIGFDMLTLYFLFLAAGEHISLGILLAGYGLPLVLGRVAFIVPGGVGVIESSMALLYNGLGIPPATTVVVILVYRLISFWIPGIAGFPVAAYLERSMGMPSIKQQIQDPCE